MKKWHVLCIYWYYTKVTITKNGRSERKIRRRIFLVKDAFLQKYALLTNKNVDILREKLIKIYVWSILYGCESSVINGADKKRLEVVEMWFWRKMLRIKWTNKTRNENILNKTMERRTLVNTIKKRRKSLLDIYWGITRLYEQL